MQTHTRCRPLSRLAQRLAIAFLVLGVIAVTSREAAAEPRFAVREGMRCGDCHVNRTGGGMRTSYGTSFAQSNLATYRTAGVFDPHAGGNFSFGGNLRLTNRTLFAAKTTLNGVERESLGSNSFEMSEGNLYFLAQAIPNKLSFYIDETLAPESATNREAFALIEGLPLDGYVKAGRFMLPFGLRIWDDRAFIRQETGFNYANSDLGVEGGLTWRDLLVQVAISNGSLGSSDTNKSKQVSSHATYLAGPARAGVSFAWNDTSTNAFSFHSYTTGAHLGARLGRLYLLAEMDWIHGVSGSDDYDQWGAYFEANFEAIKGLYLRGVFEAFDPLVDLDNNERDRFIFGTSWFPTQLMELRAHFRLNRDIPQRVEATADELVFEAHFFM